MESYTRRYTNMSLISMSKTSSGYNDWSSSVSENCAQLIEVS